MNSFDKVSSDNVQIHTITRKKANSKDFQVGQSQTYSDYLGSERGNISIITHSLIFAILVGSLRHEA